MTNTHVEPSRAIPIVESAEVVVCGAGPAGVAAALAAGRRGARTVLLESHGCLGGIWTAGCLSWILDNGNKGGLMREITDTLQARGVCCEPVRGGTAYDVEAMKLLLEELCTQTGVQVRLHTRVAAAGRDAAGKLAVAITESKSGREAWAGRVFIDATGDGDLAAQAGCGFEFGRPGSGESQPMTLMALVGGVDYAAVKPFVHHKEHAWGEDSRKLLALLKTVGVEPSYGSPSFFRIHDDLLALMCNHQYGKSGLDAQQISDATLQARREVHAFVNGLRACGGPWAGVRLVATAAQIGVREGRRIHGRYTVTAEDLIRGARHEDAVCRVTFPVDVHATNSKTGKSYSTEGIKAQPYDIPLRALVAAEVDGLLLAGRCISGDFFAHASYRVTGNAVAMGEAAGTLAALAAKSNRLPHDVPFHEVAPLLPR